MAFLDDEPFAERRPRQRGRRPPPPGDRPPPPERQQQIVVRRAIAVGVGVLILILLVLGVRGCLNARKERAFENYVSDLSSITAETKNLSEGFFSRLEDPGDLTPLQFEAEIKADRSAAEGLLDRAQGLDSPDEVAEAEELIVLSYELRRDGLAEISETVATALGDKGANKATNAIAQQMRVFLASDVLFQRGQERIADVLEQENIEGANAPNSRFLPNEPDWLDKDVVADALSEVSGEGGPAAPGVHGLGLLQTTLLPAGAVLEPGVPVTAAADGAELEIEVQNQGESEETDISVRYELEAGSDSSRGEEQISRIEPGETGTVNIPIQPAPPAGEPAQITVVVEPVPGEEVEDNNEATYEVTFE